jgi:hypothetical protein
VGSSINEFRGKLFDTLEHDSHVLLLAVVGYDDRTVKIVVLFFEHNKTDVFCLIGWNALRIDEYTGMQAMWLTLENDSPFTLFVNAWLYMLLYGLDTYRGADTLGIILFERRTDTSIKIIKSFIAPFAACPVHLRKW